MMTTAERGAKQCRECQTTGGARQSGKNRPVRRNGYCHACHNGITGCAKAEPCAECKTRHGLGDPVTRKPWREDGLCYRCTADALAREDDLIARLVRMRIDSAACFEDYESPERQGDDPTPKEIEEATAALRKKHLEWMRQSQVVASGKVGITAYRRFRERAHAGGAA